MPETRLLVARTERGDERSGRTQGSPPACRKAASGHVEPGHKDALIFTQAFTDYCNYLFEKVEAANRASAEKDPTIPQNEPLWHTRVVGLGKLYLNPKWEGWTLAEISRAPEEVRDWHSDVSKRAGAVTGNKVAKILRATYRYAKRLRRDRHPSCRPAA